MNDEMSAWNALAIEDSRQSSAVSPYSVPTDANIEDSSLGGGGSAPGIGPGTALSALSSGLGAFGSLLAGQESQDAYNYNAQLALTQGQFEVQDLDTAEQDTLSTQKAMYAKAGVTMSGSPLDVAVHTASGFEMDKQIANYNSQSKANMLTYEGKVAKSQSQIKAGSQLLSGAATLALALA